MVDCGVSQSWAFREGLSRKRRSMWSRGSIMSFPTEVIFEITNIEVLSLGLVTEEINIPTLNINNSYCSKYSPLSLQDCRKQTHKNIQIITMFSLTTFLEKSLLWIPWIIKLNEGVMDMINWISCRQQVVLLWISILCTCPFPKRMQSDN